MPSSPATSAAPFSCAEHRRRSRCIVLLWFIVPTVLAVFAIFRDASLDYRVLALGAVLPDIIDGVTAQRMAWLHSVVVVVIVLVVVMGVTVGRRALRKRLLAIPIGMFGHLLFDGAWLTKDAFWWPVLRGAEHRLPILDRPWWLLIAQELVALVGLLYFVRRMRLATPARRRLFLRTGTLDPRLIAPEANPLRRPR